MRNTLPVLLLMQNKKKATEGRSQSAISHTVRWSKLLLQYSKNAMGGLFHTTYVIGSYQSHDTPNLYNALLRPWTAALQTGK